MTDDELTIAIIPARGGSKGVPGKNLRRVGGVPLIERAVRASAAADGVDLVVVSTDDSEITLVAEAAGARVVARPADLSGDTATSESALLHAPKSAAVMYRLGTVYLGMNEKSRARAYFEMAMDAVGDDPALKTNIRTGLDATR